MEYIPKSNARVEFDAKERLALRTAATIVNQFLVNYDKTVNEDEGTIAIGGWKFRPDSDNFSIYELIELLEDLGNDTIKIEMW